ncbi:TIGR04255 family protein [bacterium]|nr:TIGR04255 family protein [bacterium]
MQLPSKLTPEPLVEAVVEVRFESAMPQGDVISKMLLALNKSFPQFNSIDIPPELRSTPQFKYHGSMALARGNLSTRIGHNVISVNCTTPYLGWPRYFQEVKNSLKEVFRNIAIYKVERLGVRYINFFEGESNLLENLDLNFEIRKLKELSINQFFVRSNIMRNGVEQLISISDHAQINTKPQAEGILVDIDSSLSSNIPNYLSDEFYEEIDRLHRAGKELFISLLSEKFLNKFSPQYT